MRQIPWFEVYCMLLFALGIIGCMRWGAVVWVSRPHKPKSIAWADAASVFMFVLGLILLTPWVTRCVRWLWPSLEQVVGGPELLGGCILQLTLLVGLQLSQMLQQSFWRCSTLQRCSKHSLAMISFQSFCVALPCVIMGNVVWHYLLTQLQARGYIQTLELQPIVRLLQSEPGFWVWAIVIVTSTLIAPIVEEYIFRGALYRFLKGRYGELIALLASSTFFALLHWNILTFVPLVILGVLLAKAYDRAGDLRASIGLHSLFNFNTVLLILLKKDLPCYL